MVLTVLGCDPDSTTPATGWDARAGFSTEGEAARARRAEDAAACALLGASPLWLPFGSVDYERHGGDDDVRCGVVERLHGDDVLLLPGTPLTHPDHAWLARMLVAGDLPCSRLGFYAEQPYSLRARGGTPSETLRVDLAFEHRGVRVRDWVAKARAIRRYRSQLPLLGLGGRSPLAVPRHVLAEARAGGEAVAWLPQTAFAPPP